MSGASFTRVGAIVLRHVYLLRSSWPRLLELAYWPMVQLLTWGFLQSFIGQSIAGQSIAGATPGRGLMIAGGTLIGSMLLWDTMFRAQIGFSASFLEEMWSRNMANLFMSPLRSMEFAGALMLVSLLRLSVGLIPVTICAFAFFGFNLWSLGLALVAFFINLVMTSWAIGLVVSGLILRFGMGAEGLAWSILFLLMPFACVYYPVSVMPGWLQVFAWTLPPTYVFEGMRAALIDHVFRGDLMLLSFVINIALLCAGLALFVALFDNARRAGSLMQMGE
jgi:ABC-2 type transport system permease protein